MPKVHHRLKGASQRQTATAVNTAVASIMKWQQRRHLRLDKRVLQLMDSSWSKQIEQNTTNFQYIWNIIHNGIIRMKHYFTLSSFTNRNSKDPC